MVLRTREGGVARVADPLVTLKRYLVLGIEQSFYDSEETAIREFATLVANTMFIDPQGTIAAIQECRWKAPKPNWCVMALAIACSHQNQGYAWPILSNIVVNGSQMMLFVRIMETLRGWGRVPRRHIGRWYQTKNNVMLDLLKNKSRTWYGKEMSQRRIVNDVHIPYFANASGDRDLYLWLTHDIELPETHRDAPLLRAVESLATADEATVLQLIQEFRLPWETIPTNKRTKNVWEAILPHIGSTALLRNMGVLAAKKVDPEMIVEALNAVREHPLNILIAWYMYRQGYGQRSSLQWSVQSSVLNALESAFYRGFDSVDTINVKTLHALDVSSSMTWHNLGGIQGLTPRVVQAVLALVAAKKNNAADFVAFARTLVSFDVRPNDSLETVISRIEQLPYGGTHASLPVQMMLDRSLDYDGYVVYSDMQTADNNVENLLRTYRNRHPLKFVEVSMVPNNLTFKHSENDLNLQGFSADLPQTINAFLTL